MTFSCHHENMVPLGPAILEICISFTHVVRNVTVTFLGEVHSSILSGGDPAEFQIVNNDAQHGFDLILNQIVGRRARIERMTSIKLTELSFSSNSNILSPGGGTSLE